MYMAYGCLTTRACIFNVTQVQLHVHVSIQMILATTLLQVVDVITFIVKRKKVEVYSLVHVSMLPHSRAIFSVEYTSLATCTLGAYGLSF